MGGSSARVGAERSPSVFALRCPPNVKGLRGACSFSYLYLSLCVCVYLARARLREEEVSIREFEEPVASALRTCVVKAPAAAAGFHGEPAKASAPHRQGLRRPQQSRHQQEPLIPKLSKVTCYLFFSLRFRFSTGEHGLPEAPAAR